MTNEAWRSATRRRLPSIVVALLFAAWAAPCAAQSVGVSEYFGARVQAAAGVKSPLARGDFDGEGHADEAYFVRIAPAGAGKSIASDVHVVSPYGGEALNDGSSGHGIAIVLNGGAQKFLVVNFEAAPTRGFFDSPLWSEVAAWGKTPPLQSAKRNSSDLKGYPCLGKAAKSDVLLLRDEAGIDEALTWTGKTFKICLDPNNDP